MRTAEIDMADSVHPADIDTFIDNAAWAIRRINIRRVTPFSEELLI